MKFFIALIVCLTILAAVHGQMQQQRVPPITGGQQQQRGQQQSGQQQQQQPFTSLFPRQEQGQQQEEQRSPLPDYAVEARGEIRALGGKVTMPFTAVAAHLWNNGVDKCVSDIQLDLGQGKTLELVAHALESKNRMRFYLEYPGEKNSWCFARRIQDVDQKCDDYQVVEQNCGRDNKGQILITRRCTMMENGAETTSLFGWCFSRDKKLHQFEMRKIVGGSDYFTITGEVTRNLPTPTAQDENKFALSAQCAIAPFVNEESSGIGRSSERSMRSSSGSMQNIQRQQPLQQQRQQRQQQQSQTSPEQIGSLFI